MAAYNDLAHTVIDTNSLNNVLCSHPLFLFSKSVLVTMAEKVVGIILLSENYHAKAAEHFYFQHFVNFLFLFESWLMRGPKLVSNPKLANVGLHG